MAYANKENFEAYLEQKSGDIENVIHGLWISKDDTLWKRDPYFYIRLGEIADKLGQVMFAHEVLEEGLQRFPSNPRLNQLQALSMIRCGFLSKSREILTGLVREGHRDEETLGILGRVYKDMWLSSDDGSLLKRSRDLYYQAFKGSGGYYSGINAASLSLILGERDTARKLASAVLSKCLKLLKGGERDYWNLATIGEGFVVLGRYEDAARFLVRAVRESVKNYSYLASTRKQLKLLGRFTDIPQTLFSILNIPPVIGFTGHMIDHPDRGNPRFPPGITDEVKTMIREKLDSIGPAAGYSSVACGSDVLFLECMQERKAETNVIIPFDLNDFFKTSIDFAGEQWVDRANGVLANISQLIRATEGTYAGDDLLFDYANLMIMGKTILRARLLETEPVLLAVSDGSRNGREGGTAQFIQTWKSRGFRTEIIPLEELVPKSGKKKRRKKSSPKTGARQEIRRELKVILFADLVGFSSIQEEQIPAFVRNYLGRIAGHLKQTANPPLHRNMWGDAFFFVFDDIDAAAEFAIELREVGEAEGSELGLDRNLDIRVGLHAGPVYSVQEPVMDRTDYFGTHVNTAARIEPITNPGNVYASEQFAALYAAKGSSPDIECNYVGVIVLPKKFGTYPIYQVKRKNEIM